MFSSVFRFALFSLCGNSLNCIITFDLRYYLLKPLIMFLPAWKSSVTCLQCPWDPGENIVSLGTVVADDRELPCRSWEQNPGPLKEQKMLFPTEPSLWSFSTDFKNHFPDAHRNLSLLDVCMSSLEVSLFMNHLCT